MSNKAIIGLTVFSLFLIFISLYLIKTLDPGQKAKPASVSIININPNQVNVSKDFILESDSETSFTYNNLIDKFTVMYFGFSYCPDICPITMHKLSEASSKLDSNTLNKTQFIFVSVDPERDNKNTLNKFVEEFDHKFIALTGSKDEIEKLSSSLKVYYSADSKKENGSYYVDHSSFIYLINPEGKLICQFTHDATAQEIAEYLKTIISNGNK